VAALEPHRVPKPFNVLHTGLIDDREGIRAALARLGIRWETARSQLRYEHASCATQGAREMQEDSALFWEKDGLVVTVLADGSRGELGNLGGGAVASLMVCESFIGAFARRTRPDHGQLIDALDAANQAIAAMVEANPLSSGMGST